MFEDELTKVADGVDTEMRQRKIQDDSQVSWLNNSVEGGTFTLLQENKLCFSIPDHFQLI